MGFGVVSILNAVFRRAFTSAGLRPSTTAVDADTTLHFWASPSLLTTSSSDSKSSKNGGGKDRPRPVVVLIHGFGPDPTWQWASQVGPLSRHFDLLVPTLLFFGASTTRAPDRSDAFQASTIASLLAGVAGAGGDEAPREVHVVGTSYGGLVAYHLARALHVQGGGWRVGKVALCSSDLAKGPEDDRALAAKCGVAEVTELMVPADTKALRRLMDICAHGPPKYIPECLARELLRKCFAVQREGKIQLIKGIATGHGFQISPLPQEVLIVWGEFDQIFPVEKAHKVKEKLGEKVTLKIIPNTGHLPQQEDSKLFNQILLNFLIPPTPVATLVK